MDLIGYLALGVLLLISRLLLFGRWRRYESSHRQAAALWASTTPMILLVVFAIRGIDNPGEVLLLAGMIAFTFGISYAIALLYLRT